MRRFVLLVAVSCAGVLTAQQPVDNYSIPSKSRYTLQSFVGKRPLTRAERTNFLETSHYDDVVRFLDSLKLLGANVTLGSMGKTGQGRNLPYVIATPIISGESITSAALDAMMSNARFSISWMGLWRKDR